MASVSCIYAVDIAVAPSDNPFSHSHNCTELIFVREGNGVCRSGETQIPYRKGQLIIYQPGVLHADIPGIDGLQFCIGIQGSIAESIHPGVLDCPAEILQIINMLHDKLNEPATPERSLDMDMIAGFLAMQIKNALKQSNEQLACGENDVCEIAKRELDANIDKNYNLDQLASKVFVSKSYLRKLFKEKYGVPPLIYLLQRKLDFAEELLRITDLPVKEIASRIGIDNPYYFSTLFTRKKGVSPSNYRDAHKKSAE